MRNVTPLPQQAQNHSPQPFIRHRLQIKGAISTKKARKKNHSDNFELKYTRNAALTLLENIQSNHPKKRHRIAVALQYYKSVTKRNGKYKEKDLTKKEAFSRLFYWKKPK